MNKTYEAPELQITRFETVDVILASGDDNDNTGEYPWDQA